MTPEIERLGVELRRAIEQQTVAQSEADAAAAISKAKRDALYSAEQTIRSAHASLQQAVRDHFVPRNTQSSTSDTGSDIPGGGAT